MRIQINNNIDWTLIVNIFDIRVAVLRNIDLPPQEILERHKAHLLTGGLVSSPLRHPAFEQWYSHPGSAAWMERARLLEADIKGGVNISFVKPSDSQLMQHTKSLSELEIVIRESIESRVVTHEFMEAWYSLGELSGRWVEIETKAETAKKVRERELKSGIVQDSTARFCWVAQWLYSRNALDNGVKRHDAMVDLYNLIAQISKSELRSPLNPNHYNKKWFCLLLMCEKQPLKPGNHPDENYLLSESFVRLKPVDIRRLVNHPYITPDVLPPLRIEDFEVVRNP